VLSPDRLAAAIETGRALSLETALDYAQSDKPPAGVDRPGGRPVGTERVDERPRLAVEALGTARVRLDDEVVPPGDFSYAKPRELLYFLLDRTDCTKDEIGAALWPWSSPAQLRNSFHTTLHHLRQALRSPTWITFRNGRYGMDRNASYVYDVDTFTQLIGEARAAGGGPAAADRLERAVASYAGDYLTDLPGESWIADRRAELRRMFESALFDLGSAHLAAGRPTAAVDVFRRLVIHDPLIESAHRELIRSYAQLGDNGRALQQYRDLSRLLRAELGAAPSPETAELAATLRRPGSG
jgi:DNA-binding SARP family transcriptional activator